MAVLRRATPVVMGLALGMLALGPGLGRGFLLSYDMVFVPRPPLTAAALGLAGGPPRAVPSDAVIAALSQILPSDLVQKLVLLSVFTLACSGTAALLRGFPLPARLAAGVFFSWNPYVAERLILGQWALLLGYAGLPWVLRALAGGLDGWRRVARLCLALVPAAVGGFSAMSVSALVVVPAALVVPVSRRASAGAARSAADGQQAAAPAAAATARYGRARTVVTALLVLCAASLPWLVPALARPVHTSATGVAAFAARADTPFGSVGSLLLLGGTWNAEAVPKGYGGGAAALWLILALAGAIGYTTRCRRDPRWPGLGIAALAGLAVASIGITAVGQGALRGLIAMSPGFAVLRDGQQFVAPLALAEATGLGAVIAWGVGARQPFGIMGEKGGRRARCDLPGVVFAVTALVAPLVLLPGLAWGAAGRLRPVQYPADWLRARAMINAGPAQGSALLLPWAAYRRYSWNHGEAVLDPWPRLLARTVIWNDAVRVGNVVVPAEDPAARNLGRLITSGASLTAPLRAAGVRYVIVDEGPDGAAGTAGGSLWPRDGLARRLAGAAVMSAGSHVVVYQLDGG